ncbi:hypothetical protein ACOSP7_012879 [Xanthoceras sorbifolium]
MWRQFVVGMIVSHIPFFSQKNISIFSYPESSFSHAIPYLSSLIKLHLTLLSSRKLHLKVFYEAVVVPFVSRRLRSNLECCRRRRWNFRMRFLNISAKFHGT